MEQWKDSVGQTVLVHELEQCKAGPCPIHFPSPHHMIAWPQIWRDDRRIIERVCPHGIGHPDPDCKYAHVDFTHGCDGCCSVEKEST